MALNCSLLTTGLVGTIATGFLVNTVVGRDHGAGQPQHPQTGEFQKWATTFILWITALVASWMIGQRTGPAICAKIPLVIQNTHPVLLGTLTVLLVYSLFLFFKEVAA